jgi:hypothetical protein
VEFSVTQDDLHRLARDLRGFESRKEVLKSFRKALREPLPVLRRDIRASALATLPRRNGLNQWVARAGVTLSANISTGSRAGVTLRVGRSTGKGRRADLADVDSGAVRAPSWGRRTRGSWHTQHVTPGFAAHPVDEFAPEFFRSAESAFGQALEALRAR